MSVWVVFANLMSHLLLLRIITQPKAMNSDSQMLKKKPICTCSYLKHLGFSYTVQLRELRTLKWSNSSFINEDELHI